jgi:iron(III) transport system ATP-binding protein
MTAIELQHISKKFGQTVALDEINLSIAAGELFFLLGPSGCGKSTLLRLIAGLHEPTSGRILFNGRDVTRLDTQHRNAVMCFQSYALWPHMTVRDNVRFGLDVRKIAASDADARINEVLELVRMAEYAERKPNQLSGGQQQRVALARALAVKPDCLLLDEPLSNLDSKLRHEMRSEIRRICKTAGFTTIYVTHDQKEALSVADRIAVLEAVKFAADAAGKPMYKGRLAQVGTPGELYHKPRTAFVADFIGSTNLLPGTVVARQNGHVRVKTPAGEVLALAREDNLPADVKVSIRPEQMRFVGQNASTTATNGGTGGENRLKGWVVESTFLGEASEHVMAVVGGDGGRDGGAKIKFVCAPPLFDLPDSQVAVEFDADDALALAS